MKYIKITLIVTLAVLSSNVFAQSRHYSAATLGMGGGGTAFIDGYHANFLNPANLMFSERPKRSLGIVGGVGLRAGGTFLNLDVYDQYLTTGLTIDGATRTEMLDAWFGSDVNNTRDLATTVNIVPFGFSTRSKKMALSLATRVRTTQDVTFNKGFMNLAFFGFDSEAFGTAVPVNLNSKTLSYAEVSVGYAMEVPLPLSGLIEALPFINGVKLYAGVAPKYIVGVASTELDLTSTLQVNPVDVNNDGGITHIFDYSLYTYGEIGDDFRAYTSDRDASDSSDVSLGDYLDVPTDFGSLGSGFGVDMGVTAEFDVSLPVLSFFGGSQKLRVAMSVTDLGSVSYDKNPSIITANGTVQIDGDTQDKEVGQYFEDLSDSLGNDVYGGFNVEEASAQKYKLPGMYNFGAALTLGKLTTTLDYGFGFNDLGTNSKRSVLTLGAQYRFLGFIPLRVGTRIGGYTSAAYSAGFGIDLRVFEFSAGASVVTNSEKNGSSLGAAWSGLVFRF